MKSIAEAADTFKRKKWLIMVNFVNIEKKFLFDEVEQ